MQDKLINIVIVGHVDHGKSTVIGRLLADTNSLPEGKLEQVKKTCERNAKPFEYAFLLDALKDEQSQGITIDAARVFFRTTKRHYLILDAPGHIEFLKNMVTGASHAECALLVIDAAEGVQENSRRHGTMLSLLGIKQVAVLVNKMDLVDYSRTVFDSIVEEFQAFLSQLDVEPVAWIPVSGMQGDNIASSTNDNIASNNGDCVAACGSPWYEGPTVLEALDRFKAAPPLDDKPFRMPVQDVYKFTRAADDRRIVAGTVESGRLRPGDEVIFYPSGKRSHVKRIEVFNAESPAGAVCGQATGFTLTEQIYVKRGELAARAGEKPAPLVSSRFAVSLFWLGRKPLATGRDYTLKLGAARVPVRLAEVRKVIDASDLSDTGKSAIERHDVAECVLQTQRAIALDLADDFPGTGRFVLVDDYEIAGGGIVREALADQQSELRRRVFIRDSKWVGSDLHPIERSRRYNQRATLVLITGEVASGRKDVARLLERSLFEEGKFVYYLGIGSIRYGVDADILEGRSDEPDEDRLEHIRRMAEVANILLHAGLILIITARDITQNELDIMRTVLGDEIIESVWVGERKTTDLAPTLHLDNVSDTAEGAGRIIDMLQRKGIVFKPW
ncbi:MAG: adenylyl-sulfate kinase [Candidatus Cloacimonetes bacterium]|nr:adenylyl-sulfate kinase [Candidatus Cloacimonadota bacterium]